MYCDDKLFAYVLNLGLTDRIVLVPGVGLPSSSSLFPPLCKLESLQVQKQPTYQTYFQEAMFCCPYLCS